MDTCSCLSVPWGQLCASLSVYLAAAVCSVNVAAGIAMAPNVALGPLVATFVWNCVALSETVSEGNLALRPGALSCWGSVPRCPAITRGTGCLPKPPASAGFQCVAWVGWKLAPRPLGRPRCFFFQVPGHSWGFSQMEGRAEMSLKPSLLGLVGGGQRAIAANGLIWQTEKVQCRQEVARPPQIKPQAYIPTRR